MKSFVLILFANFSILLISAQTTTPYMYDGIANNWSGTGVAGVYRVLGTSSHKFTRQASFSGDNSYKINNQSENNDGNFDNPSGSKVWSGNLTINIQGTAYVYDMGNEGDAGKYATTNGKFYTYCWQDVGTGSNASAIVMETSATPADLTSVSQAPILSDVHQGQDVTVSLTLSNAPSVEENLYLRYSTNNFSSYGNLISPQTGGTTTKTFIIPSQSQGTTITYYLFSTTLSSGAIQNNSFLTDLSTINYINNSGSNYQYTVQSPLPVELSYFKAKPNTHDVELFWETSSELNNEVFLLEKSLDAKSWSQFAEIKGTGNSVITQFYSITDLNPHNGKSYYRLGQKDFDGTIQYSRIEQVNLTFSEFLVGPNPVIDELKVAFDRQLFQVGNFSILDMLGRVKMEIEPGDNNGEISIPMQNFEKGTYILQILGKEGQIIKTMFIYKF